MTDDTLLTNVAITLREIAANSDTTTGKALKLIEKAAKKGQCSLRLKVSAAEHDWANEKKWGREPDYTPPMIEKLLSMGFSIGHPDYDLSFWHSDHIYYITVMW